MDSSVKESRQRFADCWSAMADNHKRMLEDMRFSNPADPQQWDRGVMRDRGDRPMLTFDQTGQYIAQVVNDARQNKPQMRVRPVDDDADPKAAKALNGLLYHIQDASRADIAYDTCIESAARIGIGWMKVETEVVDAAQNLQEIRIRRVHQYDSVVIDDQSTEPDGSDAIDGFSITTMSKASFSRQYKGAATLSFDEGGWFSSDSVRVCDYYKIVETTKNYLSVMVGGQRMDLSEDEYWTLCKQMGTQNIPYTSQWTEKTKSVKWIKMSGEEELEETDFPASHIPLIPVIGNETWVEGKRYLSGMVRRMMDAQKAYNFARSKEIEVVAMQADAVPTVANESIAGFEADWENPTSAQAYRRYNHLGEDGITPLPPPQPGQPPNYPVAFAQLTQTARDDLQASAGMYKSNLGAPSNAISGRAKMQDQREGDTANFHYLDNMSRSMRHMGSIVIEMIPKIYDTKRVQRILGQDGTPSQIIIDPNAPQAYQKDQQGQTTINPAIGMYDVSVSTGPAYATLRQEAAEQMSQLFQSNPATFPLLGALWMKHQDWPFAEEAAEILKTLQPPQVQAMGDDNPQLKQAMQQVQRLTQQVQEAQQAAQGMAEQLKQKQNDQKMANHLEEQRNNIAAYTAETNRLGVLVPSDPALAAALYQSTLQAVMQTPTPFGGTGTALPAGMPVPQLQPVQPPQQPQPPSGAPLQ